ncbi:D-aminoacyl-tRNA deacylase [Halosolutus amylolyticus]|uniref:D-aminoacyl-tRNA deacylase n=1 Tax=Halosolutus amylolyticus TaxID=2932267 RepID=A0ABD5PUC2_9EURY|nr:D-aminoacyl-tRNA deacylase [Halosolutus amylolyticus]
MTLAIVESRADRASVHICDHLRERADWTERTDDDRDPADGGGTYYRTDGAELRSFDGLHIELESPADAFDCEPDLLVFASRHSGDTGRLLTGHFTGNFGPAEFGGDDEALAEAAPNALDRLLAAFDEYAPDGYDVGMECTHHGPSAVGCPSLFAELGSGDEQWDDPAGAEAVARAILDLRGVDPHRRRQVVGFGGNHYAPRFGRIVRETPWAVGHVAADWALEAMGRPASHRDVLDRAFAASEADIAVLDGDHPDLAATIEDLGYRVVSETWLREVADRSLAFVEAVETDLGPVDDGVRFGGRRESSFVVVDLPGDLVDAAEAIDPDRVRTIVEETTVAFATENGGSRVGSTAAVPAIEDRDAIVEALAAVLERKYETVRIEDDAVVAEETAFDPALAREVGVPEGPKFGALASGESVTIDGEQVTPERVSSRQTHEFPI